MLKCFNLRTPEESLNTGDDDNPIFRCRNYGAIREGFSFIANGIMNEDGDHFIIDLCSKSDREDIIMRLDFRAETNSLWRCSRIEGYWNYEETVLENKFRLVKLQEFQVEVLFTDEYIFVAFNGIHIVKCILDRCYADLKFIQLFGDVKLIGTEQTFIAEYPSKVPHKSHISYLFGRYEHSANIDDIESDGISVDVVAENLRYLPLPFYATFNQGFFKQEYSLVVTGRVMPKPKTIKVTLKSGRQVWSDPCIIMQLEIRFKENSQPVIAFNSYPTSEFVGEFIPNVAVNVQPEGVFGLRVKRCRTYFSVSLNNTHVHQHQYPVTITAMDTCVVQGDIQLLDIVFENN